MLKTEQRAPLRSLLYSYEVLRLYLSRLNFIAFLRPPFQLFRSTPAHAIHFSCRLCAVRAHLIFLRSVLLFQGDAVFVLCAVAGCTRADASAGHVPAEAASVLHSLTFLLSNFSAWARNLLTGGNRTAFPVCRTGSHFQRVPEVWRRRRLLDRTIMIFINSSFFCKSHSSIHK